MGEKFLEDIFIWFSIICQPIPICISLKELSEEEITLAAKSGKFKLGLVKWVGNIHIKCQYWIY